MPTVSGQSARELSHVANVVGSKPLATRLRAEMRLQKIASAGGGAAGGKNGGAAGGGEVGGDGGGVLGGSGGIEGGGRGGKIDSVTTCTSAAEIPSPSTSADATLLEVAVSLLLV